MWQAVFGEDPGVPTPLEVGSKEEGDHGEQGEAKPPPAECRPHMLQEAEADNPTAEKGEEEEEEQEEKEEGKENELWLKGEAGAQAEAEVEARRRQSKARPEPSIWDAVFGEAEESLTKSTEARHDGEPGSSRDLEDVDLHRLPRFPADWPNEFGAVISLPLAVSRPETDEEVSIKDFSEVATETKESQQCREDAEPARLSEPQWREPPPEEVEEVVAQGRHAETEDADVQAALELLDSFSDRLASPDEEQLLLDLRQALKADLDAAPQFEELVGDVRLLRTLRSSDHQVEKATEAFRKHLAARQEFGLDAAREHIAETFGNRLWELRAEELPQGEVIGSFLPEVLVFSRALNGNPVSAACWGKNNPKSLVSIDGWQDKFREYQIHLWEWRAMLLDRSSREQGRLVHFVNVVDLQNWSMMGNLDSELTAYQQELAPMSQSYHDFNTRFFFIRTSVWARGAWNMFSVLIPDKVRDKTYFFSDDFLEVPDLRKVLDAPALDALRQHEFGIFDPSKRRVQEGCVTISANDAFDLAVELPANATLYWDFDVEGGELEFSLVRPREDGGMPVKSWEPLEVSGEGERTSGMLRKAGEAFGYPDGDDTEWPRRLLLRWDNTEAWWWSRTVHYRVQVVPHVDEEALKQGLPASWLRMAFASILVLLVAVLLQAGLQAWRPAHGAECLQRGMRSLEE